MPNQPTDITASLQQNAGSLRALAVLLVGPSDAEDLLQDVALDRLTTTITPDSEPGFARRAIRFLAGRHRRRRALDRNFTGRPTAPSTQTPLDDAARRETIATLHELLMALPEPYLGTVLRRFFAAETPGQIAVATGTPLATVKSRLQRGLAMLRTAFEQRNGRDWRLALGGAFALPARRSAVVASQGAGSIAIAVTMLAVASLAAWIAWGRSNELPPARRSETTATAPAPSPTPANATGSPRREAADHAKPVRPVPKPPQFVLCKLRGRVLDDAGDPIAGSTLRYTPLRVNRAYEPTPHPTAFAEAETNAMGEFALIVPALPFATWLELRHPDHGTRLVSMLPAAHGTQVPPNRQIAPGANVEVGVIQLRRLVPLRGRVLDETGHPRAGATVRLQPERQPNGVPVRATTDAEGRFSARVEPREYRREVDGWLTDIGRIEVSPPATTTEIRVPNRGAIAELDGFAVDFEGCPIPHAEVRAIARDSGANAFALADRRGQFTLRNTGSAFDTEELTLRATHPDHDIGELSRARWGERGVRVTLPRLVSRHLDIVTPNGKPTAGVRVLVRPVASEHRTSIHEFRNVPIDRPTGLPRGELEFVILPDDPTRFATTFAQAHNRFDDDGTPLRLMARAAVPFEVRVVGHDGQPLGRAWVELAELRDGQFTAVTLPCGLEHWPYHRRTGRALRHDARLTDGSGSATLHGPGIAAAGLRVTAVGHTPLVVHPLVPDADGHITVHLRAEKPHSAPPRNRTGSARIVPHPLELLPRFPGHAKVRLFREDQRSISVPDNGMTIRLDGPTHVTDVPPGRWRIDYRWHQTHWRTVGNVEVHADTTHEVRVDLRPLRPGSIDATLAWEGTPIAITSNPTIDWRNAAGKWVGCRRVELDRDRRFVADLLPGHYRLRLAMGSGHPPWPLRSSEFDIRPGQTTFQAFELDQ